MHEIKLAIAAAALLALTLGAGCGSEGGTPAPGDDKGTDKLGPPPTDSAAQAAAAEQAYQRYLQEERETVEKADSWCKDGCRKVYSCELELRKELGEAIWTARFGANEEVCVKGCLEQTPLASAECKSCLSVSCGELRQCITKQCNVDLYKL